MSMMMLYNNNNSNNNILHGVKSKKDVNDDAVYYQLQHVCMCTRCYQHMLPDRAYEDHCPQLQSIVSKIVLKRSSNFADLFAHEKFMPFIDMFQKESVKVVFLFHRLWC